MTAAALTLPLLAGCGQRGPLYLPTVPPMPTPPPGLGYATPPSTSATPNSTTQPSAAGLESGYGDTGDTNRAFVPGRSPAGAQ